MPLGFEAPKRLGSRANPEGIASLSPGLRVPAEVLLTEAGGTSYPG
jgi:hypothetical protein